MKEFYKAAQQHQESLLQRLHKRETINEQPTLVESNSKSVEDTPSPTRTETEADSSTNHELDSCLNTNSSKTSKGPSEDDLDALLNMTTPAENRASRPKSEKIISAG